MNVITDKTRINYLAVNLRRAMELHGWTQEELEARSGVPQATISELLNAKRDPRGTVLIRIAEACETSIDLLFSEPRSTILEKTA